jgi:hypothetical protein
MSKSGLVLAMAMLGLSCTLPDWCYHIQAHECFSHRTQNKTVTDYHRGGSSKLMETAAYHHKPSCLHEA